MNKQQRRDLLLMRIAVVTWTMPLRSLCALLGLLADEVGEVNLSPEGREWCLRTLRAEVADGE